MTLTEDIEDNNLSWEVILILVVLPIVLYLGLNIMGTIYYRKLGDKATAGYTASVILGWLIFPFANLASPIRYATEKNA